MKTPFTPEDSFLNGSQSQIPSTQNYGMWPWLMGAMLVAILGVSALGVMNGRTSIEPYVPYILVTFASIGLVAVLGLGTGFLRVHNDDVQSHGRGQYGQKTVYLEGVVDDVPDPTVVLDEQGRVLYANKAYQMLCGNTSETLLPNVATLLSITPAAAEIFARLQRAVDTKRAAREEIVFPVDAASGIQAKLAYRVQAIPLSQEREPAVSVWMVQDITREKQRDEGIFEELRSAIDTIDHAPIGFFSSDARGKVTFANATLVQWLGLDFVKVFSGEYKTRDMLAGDGATLLLSMSPKTGDAIGQCETIDLDMMTASGERIPVRLLHSVTAAADGSAAGSRTVVINRRAGADVVDDARSAELRFARFFHNAPIAVATLDDTGHIARHNAAYARLASTLGNGVQNQKLWLLVQEKDRLALQALVQKLRRGEVHDEPLELGLAGNGDRHARFFLAPVSDDGAAGEAVIVYIIETTEQKALELQFAQSQKMQAIGQLAGGIAHDFNNVLTAIIGFSDLLLSHHRPTDPAFQDIMNIKQNANRAAGLVRQLLAFSRKQTLRPEMLNLSDVLSDLKVMLARLLGEKVAFKLLHGRDLWTSLADTGQFEQVVINLAVNARDAMPEGGKLTIRTANVPAREVEHLQHRGMPLADYVLVEITDSGTGIEPEIIDKIFEPFFSTKEVGKGTGLGLSTVYGIVKQTGGFIYCESELGVGTTFKIYLPRHIPVAKPEPTAEEIAAKALLAATPARDLTGQGKILLVEDEDPVRAFAERALASRGYTVFAASNAAEAIAFMEENLADIELIVSDVVMPEMDGPTLLKELKKLKPEVRVIFMSGYAEEAFRKSLDPNVVFSFLPKPFSLKQLAETVKTVMEGG